MPRSTTLMGHNAINGWNLFWLVSIPLSLIMVVEMTRVDLDSGTGVSHLVGFSVMFAVPLIYLVTMASAMPVLVPGAFSTWLIRNRRYLGLCFAVAMAWQALFIFIMSTTHRNYYFDEIYLLRDELEGSTGYIFLTAMVLTSFRFGRRYLTPSQWKLLHRSGIYFLWAYPFSVYWWNLSYYPNPRPIDYVFYWAGFMALAMRIAAWGVRRKRAGVGDDPGTPVVLASRILGLALIAGGLALGIGSLYWQAPMTGFLTATGWSANLEQWLPFWPFEPFLSLLLIGLGTLVVTQYSAESKLDRAEIVA